MWPFMGVSRSPLMGEDPFLLDSSALQKQESYPSRNRVRRLTQRGKVDSCHFTDALKKILVRSYLGSEGLFLSFARYLTDANLSQDEKKKSYLKKKLQFQTYAPPQINKMLIKEQPPNHARNLFLKR